ncbi:hypothetical protein, partial [Cronobacter sakazakii]|uniref:hypothetical protein n=1 Tax=Cronobacter sakazakii TaxID=28141 RepID=UPI001956F2A4
KMTSSDVLELTHQNARTRCVFGVPPARQIFLVRLCPTPEGLLFFCYLFAISGAFEPFGCSPFAIFLLLFCYRTATPLFLRSINKAR